MPRGRGLSKAGVTVATANRTATNLQAVEDSPRTEVRDGRGHGEPPDRLTNALDSEARFGCKGKGRHQITWHGGKVSVITHLATDLIVAVDLMPANAVDGSQRR